VSITIDGRHLVRRKLFWFFGIWAASVIVVATIATALRWLLQV
jgi:hypothetical protein